MRIRDAKDKKNGISKEVEVKEMDAKDGKEMDGGKEEGEEEVHRLPPLRLFLTVAVVSLSGYFHFGYQLGVANTAQAVLRQFINESYIVHHGTALTAGEDTFLWGLYVGCFQLTAVLGTQLAQLTVDAFGRRAVFYMNAVIALLAGTMALLAFHFDVFHLLFVSRSMYGLTLGCGVAVSSIYLTEITPARYRGAVNVFGSVIVRSMHILAFLLSSPQTLGTPTHWPYIYMVEMAVTVLHIVGLLLVVLESPAFLVATGDRDHAAKVVRSIHGPTVDTNAVLGSIDKELEYSQSKMHLHTVLANPYIRRGALMGIFASIIQGVSGINIVASLSSYMLTSTGMTHGEAAIASIVIGCGGLIATLLLTYTIERHGRRPMLLISLAALTVCVAGMMAIVMAYKQFGMAGPTVAYAYTGVQVLFLFAFSLGVGPISWFYASELVPTSARAATQSAASSCTFFLSGLAPIYFLPLYEAASYYAFLTVVIPSSICLIIAYAYMPETKNRTIPEILCELNGGVDEAESKNVEELGDARNDEIHIDCVTSV